MRNEVKFSIVALDLFERPVRLRLPFRFGAATLRERRKHLSVRKFALPMVAARPAGRRK